MHKNFLKTLALLLFVALTLPACGAAPAATTTTAATTAAGAAATTAATTTAAAGAAATTTAATSAAATTAAGGAATTTAEATEAASLPEDLVEIEFMNMDQNWKVPTWGEDPVTTVFMQKTGVKMICAAPQGDGTQIANVMLAAGDYPEMMHMSINPTFNAYATGGALMSIDELAAEYGYDSIMNGDYIPESVLRIRASADGHLYMVPNWFSDDGFGSVGTAVNVRNDIYEQLGAPEVKTVDDLYNYLVSVKELNMTSPDGLPMYPLAYNHNDRNFVGYIANWWGNNIFRYSYFNEETQKVEFYLRNPDVAEAIKFLSKCLADGLLDPEVLTQDSTQQEEAWNTGKYATIMCEMWSMRTPNTALTAQFDEGMYYKTIAPPQGNPDKTPYMGRYHLIGGSGTMITKNCKNPEAAMRFINYFLSPEGEILNFYGVEGNSMEFVDGQPKLFQEAYDFKVSDWEGARVKYGIRAFDMMNNAKYNWERDQEDELTRTNRALAASTAFDGSILSAIIIDPASDEGVLFAEIEANIRAQLTQIIMEPDPAKIDTMVADVLAEYERRGLASLEELMTADYVSKMG